jgi:hypothetical protein
MPALAAGADPDPLASSFGRSSSERLSMSPQLSRDIPDDLSAQYVTGEVNELSAPDKKQQKNRGAIHRAR